MSNARRFYYVGLVVAATLVMWLVAADFDGESAVAAPRGADPRQAQALEASVEHEPHTPDSRLVAQPGTRAAAPSYDGIADKAQERGAATGGGETLAQETTSFRNNFARIDTLRSLDGNDRRWAAEVAEKVDATMRGVPEFKGSSITSLECSRTLCRLEAKHEDDTQGHKFMMLLPLKIGMMFGGGGTAYLEPEEHVTRFYFARSGAKLPSRHD